MNLTIINEDGAVYVDGVPFARLDLSSSGIPENVHALQWKVNLGWIEFKDNVDGTKPQNEVISELPNWANNCVTIYNNKMAEIQAEQAAAVERAARTQPATTGTQTL